MAGGVLDHSSHLMMQAYLRRTSPPGRSRKYLGGGTSMKSSLSMKSSRVRAIWRVVGASSCGLSTASHAMTSPGRDVGQDQLDRPQDREPAQRRPVELLADRVLEDRHVGHAVVLGHAIDWTNRRTAAAGTPRRRRPEIVGSRGSSQPATTFSCTSWSSLRLLTMV